MTKAHNNQKAWWGPINRLLTPQRQAYAIITGIVLWIVWIASLILGKGNFDLAHQVIGTDYLQFYASGITLARNDADKLYDFVYQAQLEQEIAGPDLQNFHAFITPPFLAWVFLPLSRLPYVLSFVIWSGVSLIAVYISLHFLCGHKPWRESAWALCWFPVFSSISFGQNSLLTLLLLSLTYHLWKKQRGFLAGLIASLVLFKPQLVVGVALLWLINIRKEWRALSGLLLGGGILASLSVLLLPDATLNYLIFIRNFLPSMIYNEQFPLYHLHALRGFWLLLIPRIGWGAEVASLFISILAVVYFIKFVRKNNYPALQYAAAICVTILITPHAMIYDWSILLIAATLVWQATHELQSYWRVVFAIVWLISLISGPFSFVQLKILPIALQISVPVYSILLIDMYGKLQYWPQKITWK